MKRVILLIMVSISFGIAFNSCGPNEKKIREKIEKEHRIANEKAEAERREQQRLREQRQQEMESRTFTIARRIFEIEEALNWSYSLGVTLGADDKSLGPGRKYIYGHGKEESFKSFWISDYGIPDNEKARQIYNKGLQQYMKGYENGYNF